MGQRRCRRRIASIVVGAAGWWLLALGGVAAADVIVVQRADYVVNDSGSFLSVEARTDQAGATLSLAWDTGLGTAMGSGGTVTMTRFDDTDATPDAYLYHRALVRVAVRPSTVRVASSAAGVATRPVADWVGSAAPHPAGYLSGFTVAYLDPQQVRTRINDLAAEFSALTTVVNLPEQTNGYRRKAQWVFGTATAYAGTTGDLTAAEGARAVVLTSKADGDEGGNTISAQLLAPGAPNSPLSVSVMGSVISVGLATNAGSALSSTAAQIVAAINASPSASALVTAETYRGDAGASVAAATASHALSDFLAAPGTVARDPFQQRLLRVGAHRDGTRVGVFIFAQADGRQLVAPLVAIELVERLLRNYGTDPATTALLDELELFVVPNANPDGANFALYDASSQSKTLVNRCGAGTSNDPLARTTWGVALERNFSIGSLFDGYFGGSTSCTSAAFSGPFELSEPETRNVAWVASTFSNIRFSVDLQANGGYLTWSPGAYADNGSRAPLPSPSAMFDDFMAATAARVVANLALHRGRSILPQRTGQRIDVTSSAAGNAVDQLTYNNGHFGLELVVGPALVSAPPGVTPSLVDPGLAPAFSPEGVAEVMEAADGLLGLLAVARSYALDTTAPVAIPSPGASTSGAPVAVTFTTSEPAAVHYSVDGSTPTLASPTWSGEGLRRAATAPITFAASGTLKWIAVDMKGNVSAVQSASYLVDTTPPVTTAAVNGTAAGGWYPATTVTLSAADEAGGSGVASTEHRLDGGPFAPYTAPVPVTTDGPHLLEFRSRDVAGNEEAIRSIAVKVDATAPTIDVTSPANGAILRRGAVVLAGYTCTDAASGLASCAGTVPSGARLDTSTRGTFAFAVTARDAVGNERTVQRSYRVVNDSTPPQVRIRTPAVGARYARGQRVRADYTCRDAGVGVATCTGSVADGARLPTATPGVRSLTVVATDRAGNRRSVTRTYVVVGTLPRVTLTPRRVNGVLTSGVKVDLRPAFRTRLRVTGTLQRGANGPVGNLGAVQVEVGAGRTRSVTLRVGPAAAQRLRAAGAGSMRATLRVRQQAGSLTRTDTFQFVVVA